MLETLLPKLLEMKGWRQRDLALEANVDPAQLSRIKNGYAPPFPLIEKLAVALDVPVDLLMVASRRLPPEFPRSREMVKFLAELSMANPSASVIEGLREELKQKASAQSADKWWPRRCVRLDTYTPTFEQTRRLKAIDKFAGAEFATVYRWFDLALAPPVRIRHVVEKYGLSIRETTDPWSSSAEAYLDEFSREIAVFADKRGSGRTNFSIAHELGHYTLRKVLNDHSRPNSKRDESRLEREANRFASGFLMPIRLVDIGVSRYGAYPKLLAGRFDVSEDAMANRLAELGYTRASRKTALR